MNNAPNLNINHEEEVDYNHQGQYNQQISTQITQTMQTTADNASNMQTQKPIQQYSQNSQHNINQQEQKWKKVEYKKRIRNSPEDTNSRKRQTSISDYWLNKPVETNNIYEKLSDEETSEKSEKLDSNLNRIETKSPPIFVEGVENIIPLKQLLENIAKDKYTIKILRNNQVKIQPLSSEKYLPIMEALKKKGTQGFTYQSKNDRKFKVVLRNMHSTTNLEELKKEIENKNHKVIKITNILHAKTKEPLPLFFIELEQRDNNKDIYKINQILNTIISFEQPYKKRDIPQCTRCQAYGHTKNYCFRSPRCVKCAENHITSDCPRKAKFEEVKCYNCGGNHPASYKGCEIRKQLQQKLFPKLRLKQQMDKPKQQNQTANTNIAEQIQPNISYAQITKMDRISLEQAEKTQQMTATNTTGQQGINKIEEMLLQLISKMDNMLSLLAAMITKIK